MIPISLLDLAPITEGSNAAESLSHTVALAQTAERTGYHRYWMAEHHNMPGVASSATAVLIGHVAGATSRMRVGAGGIMLPNHSPLQVAEQFGTLATLYPNRIDLGLGRAPGTDQPTAHALRRYFKGANDYPQNVVELLNYFQPEAPGQTVRAIPGEGTDVEVWLLGSSLFSAELAAHLGLSYSFASHFAPAAMEQAVATYRQNFQPSAQLDKPNAMIALNVVAAETNDEAKKLFTSQQQMFIKLRRGNPGKIPPPIDDLRAYAHPTELHNLEQALSCSVVGNPDTVRQGVEHFIERLQPDELIVTNHVFDPNARRRSFEILAEVMQMTE